jgi:ABC-type multidrug transport system ATPase subunit
MLKELLRALGQESTTVIMSTHHLETGLELCDRLAILAQGQIAHQMEKPSLGLAEVRAAYRTYTSQGRRHGES